METAKKLQNAELTTASNDNRSALPSSVRAFPNDAVARIYKPSRSVLTSGRARTSKWRLIFERRTAPVIEPLMGYTGGDDTLVQVELSFPTLESALRYAERQGLKYTVCGSPKSNDQRGGKAAARVKNPHSSRVFSDQTLDRLGLTALHEQYGEALAGAARRGDPNGTEEWAWPLAVVFDPTLTLEAKRSILMNWAWAEYLADHKNSEGAPERRRLSRLEEVERALLALERKTIVQRGGPDALQAA